MADTVTDTSWITPGADVVVYADTYRITDSPTFHVTTVKTVATKSFTVDAVADRINLADLASKQLGSSYTGWRWRAVPVDSDKHRDLVERWRRSNLEHAAWAATEKWRMNRTDRNLAAAAADAFAALCDALTSQ